MATAIANPNAKTIWHDAPLTEYEQIRLNENFMQYLETSLKSKKVFRMGIQKTPLEKLYKLVIGAQFYTVEFTAANRQVDWLKVSLVYDKSNQQKIT